MPDASLVGREREVDLIVRLLDGVHDRGGVVVLEGVAGIGKSTLLAEAQRIAADRDTAER
jgi:predicted ATPase